MTENEPKEPSVLDYLKSKLSFGRKPRIEIPKFQRAESDARAVVPEFVETKVVHAATARHLPAVAFPWLSLVAVGLALLAQRMFEPPNPAALTGIAFYLLALAALLWAILRSEWSLAPLAESSSGNDPLTFRPYAFLISIPLAVLAFLFFTGNLFTLFNLTLWLMALVLLIGSLWLVNRNVPSIWQRLREFMARREWQIHISRWMLLILALSLVIIFFRVYHIQQTPAEPFSDHAEKILDIYDILHGQTHIFFPRNTGREALGMYWIVLTVWIFNTGLSFLTLKIATISMGLLTLPYIYLLGREIGGPRVGLLAFFLAGVGYWPNVISRIGLRFPLYPLLAAPTLYYLIRGLRTRNRNDFILSGIFLGIGLHGYTPFRVVPVVVTAAVLLFILHAQSKGARRDAALWLVIVGIISLYIFLPLLRYAQENPGIFFERTISRVGTIEQPLPGPWYEVFASNVWNALRMFNWNDGTVWVNSVPNRPALDIVTGALFLIGIVLVLARYVQKRHWLDLFLLVSIPVFQLASTLSLAFPDENPELNRLGGSYIPAFILIALALDGLITAIGSDKKRKILAWILAAVLLFWSAAQSYDLVFNEFDQEFRLSSWNSSEMGEVIKEFGLMYGETNTVWIVPFPYWVDTRLPGVWAGIPNRDFAMFPDQLADTLSVPGTKLFMVKADLQDPTTNDQQSLDTLKQLYPQGVLSLHHSPVPGHDFWIYFVPSQ
ncbi:MAG TPA: glycosyltransferase family 39 protein [Anaerolineales bacterium]|nr:glycosyltransferase family 39 protein [Anaerolineales bacterium]